MPYVNRQGQQDVGSEQFSSVSLFSHSFSRFAGRCLRASPNSGALARQLTGQHRSGNKPRAFISPPNQTINRESVRFALVAQPGREKRAFYTNGRHGKSLPIVLSLHLFCEHFYFFIPCAVYSGQHPLSRRFYTHTRVHTHQHSSFQLCFMLNREEIKRAEDRLRRRCCWQWCSAHANRSRCERARRSRTWPDRISCRCSSTKAPSGKSMRAVRLI